MHLFSSWVQTTLGELCILDNGVKVHGEKLPLLDVKYLRGKKEAEYLDSGVVLNDGQYAILVDGENSGEVFRIHETGYMGSTFKRLLCPDDRLLNYLLYILKFNQKNFRENKKGSAIPHLDKKLFKELSINLPPLVEQERIVAKIEELFAGIDAGVENLKAVKNQIALYRQSVLKSAFEKTFKNVPLVEITSKIGSGSTPKGGKENYQQSGIPIIRSMNVLMNNFTEKGLAFLNDAQAKALNNVILKKDDVLLNITGASIGRTCVLPEKYIGARVNQHVSIIRPKKEIDSFFLSYFLSSPKIQAKITLENYGATRQALTKSALEAFQIPVPTLAEQERIVAEIESRFERADALETAVDRTLNDAEKLKQAVLKKAFSGELVPQNPDDEPASVLLDRIRAARASELPAKKGKRK